MIPHRPELRQLVARQRQTAPQPTREEQIAGFQGWHERGYLPHRDEPDLTQFVTFRLADSFPEELREPWEKLLLIEDDRQRRALLEAWLDLGHGVCHLRDAHIAAIVAAALRHFDGTRYRLIAWVVMPNHVHVLFEVGSTPMAKVVQGWKRHTAREANQLLGQNGAFWQPDYWDTYMRGDEHQQRTIRYIRNNPVKAGLVTEYQDWPWGHWSADF
jgi:REP element-mobilizing transposase RayT